MKKRLGSKKRIIAPFVWDEEDHRRAKLDALFFNLYGLEEGDAAYVLSASPIVQRRAMVVTTSETLTATATMTYPELYVGPKSWGYACKNVFILKQRKNIFPFVKRSLQEDT